MAITGAARFFISHSSADDDYARMVLEDLERRGLVGWSGFRDIKGAEAFDEKITKAIKQVDVLLVILTEASLASDDVHREIALARKEGREILGIAHDQAMVDLVGAHDEWGGYQFVINQIKKTGRWRAAEADKIAQLIHDLAAKHRAVPHLASQSGERRPRPTDPRKTAGDAELLRAQVLRLEDDVFDQSPELAVTLTNTFVTCLAIIASSLRIEPVDPDRVGIGELIDALGLGAEPVPDDAFWEPWPFPDLGPLVLLTQKADSSAAKIINAGRRGMGLTAHADLVGWVERNLLDRPEQELAEKLRVLDEWLRADPNTEKNLINIAPPWAGEREWDISDWANKKVNRLVRDGGFTGIVGAGATQIGARTATMVLDSDLRILLTQDPTDRGADILKFFGHVVDDRLDRRGYEMQPAPSERARLHLVQRDLLTIAHDATRLLIDELTANLRPIDDWDRISANVGGPDFANRLEGLAGILGECSKLAGLGARAMQVRLEAMAETIREGGGAYMLSGAEIEWLTDLFWHSFTFYARSYPRTGELALQVALVQESALDQPRWDRPRERLEPAASVYRHDAKAVDKAVADAVLRGFSEDDKGPRREFYRQVAAVAAQEYDRWDRARASSGTQRRPPLSVIVSTTYDLEIERALAASGGGRYHVALPVVEPVDPPRSRVQRGTLRWLLGTFEPSRAAPTLDELRDGGTWRWADDLNSSADLPEIEGPIVVKLDGSPLHTIRAPEVREPAATGVANRPRGLNAQLEERSASSPASSQTPSKEPLHGVVLGEYDFLQYFHVELSLYARADASKTTLPKWLFSELRDDRRTWLLLGLRLADWNSRMQLFIQASRAAPGRGRFFAIQEKFDEDSAQLLTAIGVERVRGDLRHLTMPLQKSLEGQADKVERTR